MPRNLYLTKTATMAQRRVNVPGLQGQIEQAVRKEVAQLTPEQKEEQFRRMVQQKLEAFTTGIVFNAVQGQGYIPEDEGRALVSTAVEMAYELLRQLHGIERKTEGQ